MQETSVSHSSKFCVKLQNYTSCSGVLFSTDPTKRACIESVKGRGEGALILAAVVVVSALSSSSTTFFVLSWSFTSLSHPLLHPHLENYPLSYGATWAFPSPTSTCLVGLPGACQNLRCPVRHRELLMMILFQKLIRI